MPRGHRPVKSIMLWSETSCFISLMYTVILSFDSFTAVLTLPILLFDANFQFIHLLLMFHHWALQALGLCLTVSLTPLWNTPWIWPLSWTSTGWKGQGSIFCILEGAEFWSHIFWSVKTSEELSYNSSHFRISSDGPFPAKRTRFWKQSSFMKNT